MTAVLAPTYAASGVGAKPTVQLSAVNLQIVNGAGKTASVNGTGNLVLGYAENPTSQPQTGSHDLILGQNQGYTGYAGLLAGYGNTASGNYATVTGGTDHPGEYATVTGGAGNHATGQASGITGGCDNLTGTGTNPSTSCAATGIQTILGGQQNQATGTLATISGGRDNIASGSGSSVSGGQFNAASDPFSAVSGGCQNVAGSASSPSGSCIVGSETVLGGLQNVATGNNSTVGGGSQNHVSGSSASIGGGVANKADGTQASVGGGANNDATGQAATVSGGTANYATDSGGAILGGCLNATGAGGNPLRATASCANAIPPAFNAVSGGQGNTSGSISSSVGDSILGGSGVTLSGSNQTSP
jgi:hypothetical protein